jgi:hypothetical protein
MCTKRADVINSEKRQKQKRETIFRRSLVLYPKWESNPHSFRNTSLSRARLPVPPFGQMGTTKVIESRWFLAYSPHFSQRATSGCEFFIAEADIVESSASLFSSHTFREVKS